MKTIFTLAMTTAMTAAGFVGDFQTDTFKTASGNMSIGIGDAAAMLLLTGFGALAWRRKKAGGKTWAFRIIPFGIMLMVLVGKLLETWWFFLVLTFAAYALAAYRGGWRLRNPRNRILRGAWARDGVSP